MIVKNGAVAIKDLPYDLLTKVFYQGRSGIVKAVEVLPDSDRRQVDFTTERQWISTAELQREELRLLTLRQIVEGITAEAYGEPVLLSDGQLGAFSILVNHYTPGERTREEYCKKTGWHDAVVETMSALNVSEADCKKLADSLDAIAQALEEVEQR